MFHGKLRLPSNQGSLSNASGFTNDTWTRLSRVGPSTQAATAACCDLFRDPDSAWVKAGGMLVWRSDLGRELPSGGSGLSSCRSSSPGSRCVLQSACAAAD